MPTINLKYLENLDTINNEEVLEKSFNKEIQTSCLDKCVKMDVKSLLKNDIEVFETISNTVIEQPSNTLRKINFSRKQTPTIEIIKYKRKKKNAVQNESLEIPTSFTNSVKYDKTINLHTSCIDDQQILQNNCMDIDNEQQNVNLSDESTIQTDHIKNKNYLKIDNKQLISGSSIKIQHVNFPNSIQINFVWLRDHCCCYECVNIDTNQRKINILDIPLDIKPKNLEISNNDLIVKWLDGHKSQYKIDFLYSNKFENLTEKVTEKCQIVWNRNEIQNFNFACVSLNDYLCDDNVAKQVVKSLMTYGIAFIEKVPPNIQSTEITIRRLFPIQKRNSSKMFIFDSSCSKDYSAVSAHTDNTYLNDPSGLQAFHCIEHNNGTGGEIFLVDGFYIINHLKTKELSTYNRLCDYPISFSFQDKNQHYEHCDNLIKRNIITDNPEQIRFNHSTRSSLNSIPFNKIEQFYRDYRLLTSEIQSSINEWRFKLKPGTILICDNWRILHGRTEFSGKRVLVGCYVSRADFLSTAKSMNVL